MGRGFFLLALLAAVMTLTVSGHASSTPNATVCQAGDILVTIEDFDFNPSMVDVPSGGAVCWTNNGPSSQHRDG